MQKMNKTFKAIAKPFSSFPRAEHRFMLDDDGTVRVYDSVAGHYTTCHSMSERTMCRIRRKLEREAGRILDMVA